MGTATKAETSSFSKRVEFKARDEEGQVAVGGILIPNKVDKQGDFVRTGQLSG